MDPKKIDIEQFLKGLADLEKECGDWRNHVPYEAAAAYRSDPKVRRLFGAHVETCSYCQEMIELYSSDK